MRVIHVHFDAANSVTVLPASEVVFAGDEVVWEVTSTNPSITKVKLKIKKESKPFSFGGSENDPSQEIQNRRAQFRGVAPRVNEGELARYDYTVAGFDKNGNLLIGVDPVIIIVPPEPIP